VLASFLFKIQDHRRKQGRRYELGHILLFSILAILSGATSYRKIQKFIVTHYDTLDDIFDLAWDRMPAHTTLRDIIQATCGTELEQSFTEYSARLAENDVQKQFIGCDGKVLRGSFDHFKDQKAIQILSAFVSHSHLILAHQEIATKTNELKLRHKGYVNHNRRVPYQPNKLKVSGADNHTDAGCPSENRDEPVNLAPAYRTGPSVRGYQKYHSGSP
jgi:hypothetical protein